MSALIKGTTLHTWGEIPINLDQFSSADRKTVKEGFEAMFVKCAGMRWLIIDEIRLDAAGHVGKTCTKSLRQPAACA